MGSGPNEIYGVKRYHILFQNQSFLKSLKEQLHMELFLLTNTIYRVKFFLRFFSDIFGFLLCLRVCITGWLEG